LFLRTLNSKLFDTQNTQSALLILPQMVFDYGKHELCSCQHYWEQGVTVITLLY
jgi:hypothetical protein